MKKIKARKKIGLLFMLSALFTMIVSGCGTKEKTTTAAGDTETGERKYRIGVCQLVQHNALDATYEGFKEALKDAGYEEGKNLIIDYQNAQGDQSNCNTIATKLVNDKDDLILAIATPAAQAVANATKEIPVLLTAVTDPAASKLVAANDAPGGNVTGTSDLTPIKEQMQLLKQLVPDAKTVAMLYCSSEENSKIQVDIAVEAAKDLGLKTMDATVSNSNEIQQVVQSLVGKADVIYAPTDNMIAAGMKTVSMVAEPNKIPIICGESGMVENGGLATYGIDYFNLGKLTGAQAAKILSGEKKPSELPIEYLSNDQLTIMINGAVAEKLGITVPDELKDKVK